MNDLEKLPKMEKITYDKVLEKHDFEPKRRCFASHSGVQQKKQNDSRSFSVSFPDTVKPIFEKQTGLTLFHSQKYGNYFRVIETEKEYKIICSWEKNQGSLIFLRDCLSLSIALDSNLIDNKSAEYTCVGQLEHESKQNQNINAINQLTCMVTKTINALPFYKDADLICCVPPQPSKKFDLPSCLTTLTSKKINKQNITKGFIFNAQKKSATTSPYDEKWNLWENAKVSFQSNYKFNVKGKAIILIDDKYQSGVTIQYIAMKLQEAGAHQVYGLSLVKTLGDKDNNNQ